MNTDEGWQYEPSGCAEHRYSQRLADARKHPEPIVRTIVRHWPSKKVREKAAEIYEKYQGFLSSKHGKGCRLEAGNYCARHGAWAAGMAAECDSCEKQII